MASTRKSRSVPKRFSKINESPDKDGGENKKGQKKRKLSDMLGFQWSKEELQRFYDAYRKYGKDWKKVAGVVRNRSIEMVEALYNMNRAYLSLPEGTASVVGLIAMMTDHYNILEGSESDRESNDGPGMSRKPQKRGRGKVRSNISKGLEDQIPDLLHSTPAASNYGCLSLLKKKRSAGSRPRAVGKRTPRYPVSRGHGVSPNKQGKKSEVDANDDEVAHGVVRVLAEALQRGGSPQVSQAPNKRKGLMRLSPLRDGERRRTESEMASAKLGGTGMDDDYLEGSLGSREAENGDFARDTSYMMDTEGVGTVEVEQKGKKSNRKKPKLQDTQNDQFDEVREACSGTEEGLNANSIKEKVEDEVTDKKIGRRSPMGSRNRSRQLFFGDESSALDALCTLADLSMKFAPDSAIESESSAQVREEKLIGDIAEKSSTHEAMSGNHQRDKLKNLGAKERGDHMDGVRFNPLKRKRKSISSKLLRTEVQTASPLSESQKNEVPAEEGKKSTSKTKRIGHIAPLQKQGKSTRPPERSSSSTNQLKVGTDSAVEITQVPTVSQVNLPTKLRSRRKKAFVRKELKAPENIVDDRPNKSSLSIPDRALDLKQKLFRCLSSHMLRRWSAYEWFYGAIDYPWFAQNEFVEYLTHVGLGHVPRLTRVEWSVIRSSLGKPRRLCQQFLLEEKRKLEKYRESVRTHYTELRAGIREGLPTDLPQPLSVGQRVTACHPKTRELHDGSVLTVDRNKCRVQFDRPELGVELVMDVDCTPLNPLEHLPEALRRQNLAANRLHDNSSDVMLNGRSKDWKFGGFMRATPSENLDSTDGTTHMPLPSHPMNTLIKQAKVDTISAISQAKAAANEIFNAQKASYTHPCTLAQIQAREADVRALSELGRALDRKEMLVLELRHMNDEVLENQKDGDNTLKDSESFKKQYAMILVQLKEANDQVSSALLYLRQRNTYTENSPSTWQKPGVNAGNLVRPMTSFDQSAYLPQESGSRVLEILQTSRIKANTMVDAAVQAMSSLKDGEDAFSRVGDALDSATNWQHGLDSDVPTMRSIASPDLGHGGSGIQNTTNFRTSESTMMALNANGLNPTHALERSEVQIPSELISSCVATLLMIQTCTERQYPPAEVAQILDSAVSNLQPYCSQNIPIYREIQMCMGLVKNQILALIPT